VLDDRIRRARILIVDDEAANIQLLRRILEPAGYLDIRETRDPTTVETLLTELRPDLVLLDLLMPGMDGHQVLDIVRSATPGDEYLPVLVLTSDNTRDAKRRALSGGAKDYVTKPLSPSEVRSRVRNLLETRVLYQEVRAQNADLERRVQTRTAELEDARLQTLQRLARAAEYRDDVTGHHTRRVGDAAARIAATLGWPRHEVGMIRLAAPLHDVGKIGIPDDILLSDGPLTPAQFEVMKSHCVIGADILSGSDVPLLRMATEIALSHHERWDGQGYPYGLAGEEIPLAGRIVAVADTYDALTHPRPYKHAWGVDEALDDITRGASERFDPRVVEAFRATVSPAATAMSVFE
jgi:putative two-component system response regulator